MARVCKSAIETLWWGKGDMEKMSQTIQRKEKGRERRRARTGEYHPGAVHAPRDQSSRTLILCKGCGAVE
jgi:hypothetical protein